MSDLEETSELMGIITNSGVLVEEQISPNISITPEGFLLAENAIIARTGSQDYTKNEIPNSEPDNNGMIKAVRTPDEVFRPETIASFEAAPITIEHPREMISSKNWKYYSVGTTHNVRQDGSYLKADLLITDERAIREIQQNGLKKLSCGYMSKLVDISPGIVKQTYIRGNHIALTSNPRGGDICSIQDSITDTSTIINNIESKKGIKMAKVKQTIKDRLLSAIGLLDSEDLEKESDVPEEQEKVEDACDMKDEISETNQAEIEHEQLENEIGSDIKQVLETVIARLDKLEQMNLSEIESEKVEDSEEDTDESNNTSEVTEEEGYVEGTKDSDEAEGEYPIADSFKTIRSKAEILVPGIQLSVPIMDANSSEYKGAIINCKKQILEQFYLKDSGKQIMDSILKGRTINKLHTDALDILFESISTIKATKNNSVVRPTQLTDSVNQIDPIAEINRIHNELNKK